MGKLLSEKYQAWEQECEIRFQKLKANEEELNRIFLSAYQMQNLVKPEVPDKSISVRRAEKQRDIKSLINYAVGCLFGRYSLDHEGLCYAGGTFHLEYYQKIIPVQDNLLFLSDTPFPEQSISAGFENFLIQAYGADTLKENLSFVEEAIEMSIQEYFQKDFALDHYRFYHRRPIYWQLNSGKKHAFQAFFYIHRWKPDFPEFIRQKYIPAFQEYYQQKLSNAGTSLEKKQYTALLSELASYDQKLSAFSGGLLLPPDDGIAENYQKLSSVLKKLPA